MVSMKVNYLSNGVIMYNFITEDKKKAFGDLVAASITQAFVKHIEKLPSELSSLFYDHYIHDFVRNLVLPFNEEAIDSVYEVKIEPLNSRMLRNLYRYCLMS